MSRLPARVVLHVTIAGQGGPKVAHAQCTTGWVSMPWPTLLVYITYDTRQVD